MCLLKMNLKPLNLPSIAKLEIFSVEFPTLYILMQNQHCSSFDCCPVIHLSPPDILDLMACEVSKGFTGNVRDKG